MCQKNLRLPPDPQRTRSGTGRGVDRALWVEAMTSFTGSLKILLLVDSCDMREASTVFRAGEQPFWRDPRGGAPYVCGNRRHT